ncbi:Os03g0237900 [Oryza sativa Japonica Group]|uniref:Os03g0237900 protein n=1 Tax=Oryza sativa subsp. japonica TaxID=39947 RepID=A0A0P0VV92_ORYSJ|nr:hypothetical protein EE612_016378 [Oryza sativa]BAS83168.1 Os03g0237900 [Oryza sativa Japonica Group]
MDEDRAVEAAASAWPGPSRRRRLIEFLLHASTVRAPLHPLSFRHGPLDSYLTSHAAFCCDSFLAARPPSRRQVHRALLLRRPPTALPPEEDGVLWRTGWPSCDLLAARASEGQQPGALRPRCRVDRQQDSRAEAAVGEEPQGAW